MIKRIFSLLLALSLLLTVLPVPVLAAEEEQSFRETVSTF